MFESITWLTTSKCGMKCSYCNFTNRKIDATTEQMISTLELLSKWPRSNERFIVLLGGDVLSLHSVKDFVIEMNNLKLPYGFQTSAFSDKLMDDVGPLLTNLSISVDGGVKDKYRRLKQENGLKWAGYLRKINPFIDIHATITIDKENLLLVPSIVKDLTTRDIWSEITFVHWKKKNFDLVPEKSSMNCVDTTNIEDLRLLGEKLINLKRKGYLIHSSEQFLSNLHYAINLDWRCNGPSSCVIDSDLSMRMCLHCPGDRVTKWNIFDLTIENWPIFLRDWELDQKETCPSCFWDCSFEIEKTSADWINHKG